MTHHRKCLHTAGITWQTLWLPITQDSSFSAGHVLLPHSSHTTAYKPLHAHAAGITWQTLWLPITQDSSFSAGHVLLLLALDIPFYAAVTWYLDKVGVSAMFACVQSSVVHLWVCWGWVGEAGGGLALDIPVYAAFT